MLPLPRPRTLGARLLLALGLLAACVPAAAQVVIVRSVNFVILKELRTATEISEFRQLWAQQQPTGRTSEQEHDWPYTLDLLNVNHRIERWRYNPNGTAIPVAEGVQRVIRLRQPVPFNGLIGAPKYL